MEGRKEEVEQNSVFLIFISIGTIIQFAKGCIIFTTLN